MKLWRWLRSLQARNSATRVTMWQYLELLQIYLLQYPEQDRSGSKNGVSLAMSPTRDSKHRAIEERSNGFAAGSQRAQVLWMVLLLLASIALQLLGPQLIRVFIDSFQHNTDQQSLTITALFYLAVAIGSRLLTALAAYFCEAVGWNATNRLREDLTRHCLGLDRSFHTAHTPGELIERVDGDVNALAGFFSQFVIQVVGSALIVLGILVLMARENLWFGIVLAVYLLLSILFFVRMQRLATPYYKLHSQAQAELSGFWGELLIGLEDIAASGAGRYIMRRYFQLQRQENKVELKSILCWSLLENTGLLIDMLSIALVLTLSAYFFIHGLLSLGTLILLMSYSAQLLDHTLEITEQFNSLQEATASIERINEIYQAKSCVQDGPGVQLPAGALAIAFENVSFHYEMAQPVLCDLSFQVPAGGVLGLLGRSGSGKTTLTRLLMRFYDPESGSVRLGGEDIKRARLDDLRRRIGIVTQEVQLFQASLRENLTFFDSSINDQQILAAIERLGIHDWYTRLPRGLDTELGGNGGGLSAGEAQLLACIRVFLKDPQLIILDEATSRLDPATEGLMVQATEKLLEGRTAIIIAHRLSTVERVDQILVLEAGRLVEYGAREVLARDENSRYAQLLQMAEELLA